MTALDIYLIGLLLSLEDSLSSLQFFLIVVFAIGCFALGVISSTTGISPKEIFIKSKKFFIAGAVIFCITMALRYLAPTKEIVAAMFIIPPIVNNEQVQELPDNVLTFINEWLKQNTEQMSIKKSK